MIDSSATTRADGVSRANRANRSVSHAPFVLACSDLLDRSLLGATKAIGSQGVDDRIGLRRGRGGIVTDGATCFRAFVTMACFATYRSRELDDIVGVQNGVARRLGYDGAVSALNLEDVQTLEVLQAGASQWSLAQLGSLNQNQNRFQSVRACGVRISASCVYGSRCSCNVDDEIVVASFCDVRV